MRFDVRGVAFKVDAKLAIRQWLVAAAAAADFDGKTTGHLGPYEHHLGAEAELSSGLFDTVLGAGKHNPKHVRYVVVMDATSVVADNQTKIATLALLAFF
jgi:hypothetical protein